MCEFMYELNFFYVLSFLVIYFEYFDVSTSVKTYCTPTDSNTFYEVSELQMNTSRIGIVAESWLFVYSVLDT